ncbi:MAG TPA: peptidoglycan DD-metalloendopeptidase family protein, partial [Vicinamibacteria bacterium]
MPPSFRKAVRPLASWVLLSLGAWGGSLWLFGFSRLGPLPPVASSPAVAAAPEASDSPADEIVIPDRFERGDTLSSVLSRNGFGPAEVHEMGRALSAVMDVRHLRQGDEIDIRYRSGGAQSVLVHHGDLERVFLLRSNLGWQSERTAVDLDRRTVSVSGELRDNLFVSMGQLGEEASLTVAFANVFSWDFDFHTQSRRGDRFSLVVEKLYREGEFVGYGDLKAARYVSNLAGERIFSAFLYDDPDGRRDYYDSDGKSLKKAFLRAPVDFDRISSGFSYSRFHPVHHRRMPHLGVDYAARKGTPVYSVAAGVVSDRGWRGGGGNTVTVQHAMGYTSKYLHLSRFASGLTVGTRVA